MAGRSVLIALSGGVDSSVAAALLLDRGYRVYALTFQLVSPEEGAPGSARAVAGGLGIDHQLIDARSLFDELVIGPFLRDYRRGRTPNPCVRCNPLVKFSLLLEWADRLCCDLVATGHYARITAGPGGRPELRRGADPGKDQSYFLYALTGKQLARTLLPLGSLHKDQVRRIAADRGIPADRSESQELCFIGGDYRGLFSSARRPGPIVDGSGRVLGEHRGITGYTVGQRRGLGLSSDRPLYVTRIDPASNTLVVGPREQGYRRSLAVEEARWQEAPPGPFHGQVQIRSVHRPAAAVVYPEGDAARVLFDRPQWAVTPGQSAVFYRGDRVLGGGVIAGCGEEW
jgi:tRNA-specific 2-thiouridylase